MAAGTEASQVKGYYRSAGMLELLDAVKDDGGFFKIETRVCRKIVLESLSGSMTIWRSRDGFVKRQRLDAGGMGPDRVECATNSRKKKN